MIEPHNIDAEESVIGAMLLSPTAIEAVLAELEPEGERAFYRPSHGVVYRACRSLYRAGRPADRITVTALLEAKGKLADAGGEERVHELAISVPAAGNAGHYARIVRETWLKRVGAAAAWKAHEAFSNGVPSAEARQTLLDDLFALEALEQRGKDAETIGDILGRIDERIADPPPEDGLPTPFPSYPALKPERLYILGGYTGDGKTAVACQFAISAAALRNAYVGFASVEMSRDQLVDRMVASYGIPLRQIESGRLGPAYLPVYEQAKAALGRLRIDVLDDPTMTAASLEQVQRARRYDLLIVDHLHQIILKCKPDHYRHRLEEEIQAFATLARRQHVPVLLLAQLSRQSNSNPFPRPTVSMLRETARTEQQGALVSFVWRSRDERNLPTDEGEMILAKNRFGAPGAFPLAFHGETMRYTEVEKWRE